MNTIRPFAITQAIVLVALSGGLIFLLTDTYLRTLIKTHWKLLSLAVLMVAIWRFPLHNTFFHGLEYEDSYVYTVSARGELPQGTRQDVDSTYLTSTCVVGSLDSCDMFETYSGHYVGWPSVIRIAIRLFGYTPTLPVYLNIAGSCVAIVFIFLIGHLTTGDPLASFAAAVCFATTPAFAVHGVASYAEPVSNVCISAVLLWYVRYLCVSHDRPFVETLNWFVFTTALLLASLIKRENVIVAVVLSVIAVSFMLYRVGTRTIDIRKLRWVLAGSAIVLVFCAAELSLARTVLSEVQEFGQFPFALSNVKTLLPLFVRAFFVSEWYSCTFVFVLVGVFYAFRTKSMALLAVCLFACYLLLYAFHVRGYYQTHGVPVLPYETLRYSMNLMTLWSLLAGCGIAAVLRARGVLLPKRKTLVVVVACAYAAGCYIQTVKLRQDVQSDEYAVRIKAALAAARLSVQSGNPRTYIVTLEPLVVQMFASKTTNVLGLHVMDRQLLTSLRDRHPEMSILYLRQSQYANSLASERYARGLACLDSLPQKLLHSDENFSLIQMAAPRGEIRCMPSAYPEHP